MPALPVLALPVRRSQGGRGTANPDFFRIGACFPSLAVAGCAFRPQLFDITVFLVIKTRGFPARIVAKSAIELQT